MEVYYDVDGSPLRQNIFPRNWDVELTVIRSITVCLQCCPE